MNRKPKNLTTIVGKPCTPNLTPNLLELDNKLDNYRTVSLSFVLETRERGPVLCNYYAEYVSPNPICPITALIHYTRETNQEIKVEGRLIEKIIDNTGDPKKDKTECCMNIYQIDFPVFGTYIPIEPHITFKKELNGQG